MKSWMKESANNSIVIVGMARTPQGNFLGALKDVTSIELGSIAIQAALQRATLSPSKVDEVIMGCVLPAGLGQAPARQAAIHAHIPEYVPCTTINKVCGSGMKAVMMGTSFLKTEYDQKIMVAGGMESMSNAPYLLLKARTGYRLGHGEIMDHMVLDGLQDAYQKNASMGYFAEETAKALGFSRTMQDEFATLSLKRAQTSIREHYFSDEIIPVMVKTREGEKWIETDEHPSSVNIEKIPHLPAAFAKNGTVTAANSCSIADGAAALILMRLHDAQKENITPLAKIVGYSSIAKAPHQFTTAPIDAIQTLLKKINWSLQEVDLFEINEAFAVVTLAAMRELAIPIEKLNIHGGGCALGHPIGATGARIIITLISALKRLGLKRGIASLCIGGGEATAIAIECLYDIH